MNEEVRRRPGIEEELTSRADQRLLKWFGHVKRMGEPYNQKGIDGRSQWRTVTGETEVSLDVWCEGSLRKQRNNGGGCTTMRERSERVASLLHM